MKSPVLYDPERFSKNYGKNQEVKTPIPELKFRKALIGREGYAI